jgi:hypothetical protein
MDLICPIGQLWLIMWTNTYTNTFAFLSEVATFDPRNVNLGLGDPNLVLALRCKSPIENF